MIPADDEVHLVVSRFREAIDAAGGEPWEIKYITFPHGACGHAAELLGQYLINQLGIVAEYVNQVAPSAIGGWRGALWAAITSFLPKD